MQADRIQSYKKSQRNLTRNTTEKVHIIKKLTQSPRTKQVLISNGILPSEEIIEEVQLLSSIKDSIEQIKPRGTAKIETRVAYGSITIMKKSIPKATKLKKKLGVNCKAVTTAWWSNEMRKKEKTESKMI